jgi:hypothetical protein
LDFGDWTPNNGRVTTTVYDPQLKDQRTSHGTPAESCGLCSKHHLTRISMFKYFCFRNQIMHEEQTVKPKSDCIILMPIWPRTPCYNMQELQKSVITNHIPQVTEGSTLYHGRIQLLSRHMSSSSCNNNC